MRQLTYTLQGSFTSAAGKRIAPHLSKVIGCWLAGTFDADRSVARASHDALAKAFPTDQKRAALWKIYRDAILDHIKDAVILQTPQTLSDERTTSPDDAEQKCVRVVGTALSVLGEILARNITTSGTYEAKLKEILEDRKFWKFAHNQDASVRKGFFACIKPCLDNDRLNLDWHTISTAFVSKGLHTSQLGSSRQFVEALLALTNKRPTIWTTEYSGKSSAWRRLSRFLEQGSQRGPESFWVSLGQLLMAVPKDVWASGQESTEAATTELLNALRSGIGSTEEPRQNAPIAWNTHTKTALWLSDQLNDKDASQELFRGRLLPVIDQYVSPSKQTSQWTIPQPYAMRICTDIIVSITSAGHESLVVELWSRQSQLIIDAMKLSQPETSNDFRNSQDSVITKAKRYFEFQEKAIQKLATAYNTADSTAILSKSNGDIVSAALDLLHNRNGKPYGAAGVVELAFATNTKLANSMTGSSGESKIADFLKNDLASLLDSPSGNHLITLLIMCRGVEGYHESLKAVLDRFLTSHELQRTGAFALVLRYINQDELWSSPELEELVIADLKEALKGEDYYWSVVKSTMENRQLNSNFPDDATTGDANIQDRILTQMMESLDVQSSQRQALKGFASLIESDWTVSDTQATSYTSTLLPKLLVLSDSQDDQTAKLASELASAIKSLMASRGDDAATKSTIDLIAQQLNGHGQPLSIPSLVALAIEAYDSSNSENQNDLATSIFPSSEQWLAALTPFLKRSPSPSTAITSALQGTVILACSVNSNVTDEDSMHDAEGFSHLARLTLYTIRLMKDTDLIQTLPAGVVDGVYSFFPQALHFISDKLDMSTANAAWTSSSSEVMEEMIEVLAEGQKLINEWIERQEDSGDTKDDVSIAKCWLDKLANIRGTDAISYHIGCTFAAILAECTDRNGTSRYDSSWQEHVNTLHKSPDVVRSAAILAVTKESLAGSAQGKRLCNELIATATDNKKLLDDVASTRPLILLNIYLSGQEDVLESLPTQRVVFLMKTLVRDLEDENAPLRVLAEVVKVLALILPFVEDIYGEHWGQILSFLYTLWHDPIRLPDDMALLHASLRLYSRLHAMTKTEEPNDDLIDAWKDSQKKLESGLQVALGAFNTYQQGTDQPRAITAELLRRQLKSINLPTATNLDDVYALLTSSERSVQGAAFDMLHNIVPRQQEDTSLDFALENKVVHLPEELVSMLLDPPSMHSFLEDEVSADNMWLKLRSHLLSWKIVFDHFSNASFKLRELYSNDLKASGHLAGLLEFICDVLNITSGRPLDPSKFDSISVFTIDSDPSLEREVQSLTLHLYYLSLLNIPSLCKEWFISQKNHIRHPLEAWTQKHITPLIVSAVLAEVDSWAKSQDQDDRPITIKTSPRAAELTASIQIDSSGEAAPCAVLIALPGAYPLASPTVATKSRVGVSEKNWAGWLRTFQIIIFSSGSIIEGLVAFRRNVTAQLKGQTECAICYSVISPDSQMRTPDKKCATCRNVFHGSCLFKWFKSSNSSSCPLCRNNFNYA